MNGQPLPYLLRLNWVLLIFFSLLLGNCTSEQPRKIEILFLGHDQIHHNSEKYLPLLASALANKGINFSYTNQTSDLNSENLSLYDGLMIYANHDSISPDQEKALLDFVAGGKGFLPIHCASYCFRNSEKYVELVGAQFKSHETGTFKAEVINQNHPITNGFEPFESWDETYVHDKHQTDRTILMERVDSSGREPWTWVKEFGKGRVFYTASGHDERTWANPGFQDLLYRGITWAVGDRVKGLWEQLEFPEHQYSPSDDIANYEKRPEPLPFQAPFAQAESEKFIQIPPEFKLEVFATEPDIVNPVFLNWDERGRLWVIETPDYPNEVKETVGDDRIKICEDTNGDGKADKFTIFADSLNLPTSLVFANGGVIVSNTPDFLYLKDTDGDDKADLKEILISGWGTFDSHAGPSNLKYGFDNYIWGTVGYSAFKGMIAGKAYDFGQGIYRFKPDATDFEFVTPTSNNTWGLGFSESFDVFASTANNAHSWYLGIPQRFFDGIEGIPKVGSKKIADYYAFHPITQNVRQVDVFGGFTAAAGHNLYTARDFPKSYWNRMALVCEPTGHLLAKGALERDGAGFVLKDEWNLMASSDEWFSPVHAEVGPDGAVWVADWYNFIIQHNPTPTPERGGYQAETGKGNAHVNPLRDRTHGRIYRIVSKNARAPKTLKLSKTEPHQLIQTLSNNNLFWRLTAQRLLVERGEQDILPELINLVQNQTVDEIGINGGAIHALWTLHGLGALTGNNDKVNSAVIAALEHPSAGVRKAAIQVLPKTFWARRALLDANAINDPDPHTQLAALLAFAEMPADSEVGTALYQLSQSDEIAVDLWRSQALYIAATRHHSGFTNAYESDPDAVSFEIIPEEEKIRPPSIWRKWDTPQQITAEWPKLQPGTAWEENVLPDFDGRVIVYTDFEVEKIPQQAYLHLGRIGQSDYGLVNGTFLHETRNDPEKLRTYQIPVKTIEIGLNYLTLLIEDNKNSGGLLGPTEEMYLLLDDERIPLTGDWKYYILERKKRGINYSDFSNGKDLAAQFVAYYRKSQSAEVETGEESSDPNATRILLKAVKNEMKYNQSELVVTAGRAVEIIFENIDFMQHNLLIVTPGSLERVGKAADEMALQPEGQEKHYIPEIPEVLHAMGLVDPGKTLVLRFEAPQEPGDYPFVCTFPGHWRTMNGVLKVVAEVN